MSGARAKKTKTDPPATTGLALPIQNTGATPNYPTPTHAIDPSLSAIATSAASKVAQASTGYLNSAYPAYTQRLYQNYYANNPGYAPAGTPGVTTPTTAYGAYTNFYTPTQQYGATPIATPAPYASTAQVKATPATPQTTKPSPAAPAPPTLDTASVAQLTDALGTAGVDLRAEEEAMARDVRRTGLGTTPAITEDRSRKQTFLDSTVLTNRVKELTLNHALTITPDAQTYIALALQARLTSLIKQSISAVDHRIDSNCLNRPPPTYPTPPPEDPSAPQPDPLPMWNLLVRRDTAKQLAALEKVEKEEELRIRRRRKEREENEANGTTGGAEGEEDDSGKKQKKKKPEGPGVTARNMSEDMRTRLSNSVANSAGGFARKYAWMTDATAVATPVKAAPAAAAATKLASPAINGGETITTGFARPFFSTKTEQTAPDERRVTVQDLMFVVGKERGHGGGKGSARTWSVAGW